METKGVLLLVGILIFATASFIFALAESALFALGKWRAKQMAASPRGQVVIRLLQHPSDLLATIVLGNTLANGCIVTLMLGPVLQGHWQLFPTLIGLTLFILVGLELLPKTLAVRNPEHWSLRVARLIAWVQGASGWLQYLVQSFNRRILKLVIPKSMTPQSDLTEDDYREVFEMAFDQGALAKSEKEIILEIIQLDRKTAKDVMIPRSHMAAIPGNLSVKELIAASREQKHQRLPVYDDTPDTIVGLLNTQALIQNPEIDLEEVIELPSYVPETMNLLQLLISLQRQQRRLAIVVDEYGGTAGLVTVEDILEEVVGEIQTDEDPVEFEMEKLGACRWRVAGTLRMEDFRESQFPTLAEIEDVDTMGGLLMAKLEVVPQRGQSVQWSGLRLTALEVDERRVYEVLVERIN